LVSDLGGGKTAFVKGLAAGMGFTGTVHSPSFTLSNEYDIGNKRLAHFDFYRLADAGILREEMAEAIADDQTVVAVEWADIVEDVLPAEKLTVRIVPTGEMSRRLEFFYPTKLSYLLNNIT
jgi:tRNA threonylcarbamoyladenosine biosynthesis protein TsaE